MASASGSPTTFVSIGAGMMVDSVAVVGVHSLEPRPTPLSHWKPTLGRPTRDSEHSSRSAMSRPRNGASDYRCFGPWVIS